MVNRLSIFAVFVASSAMALAQSAGPAASQAAPGGQAQQTRTDRMVRFQQIDRNHDGKLSLQEFEMRPNSATPDVIPTSVDAATRADRAARFKLVDKNSDGFLTFEEFKSLEDIPAAARPQEQSESDVTRLDPALDRIVPAGARVEKLHGGFWHGEGPVWVRSGGYLLFSDPQNNTIFKWTPDGMVSAFRKPVYPGEYASGVAIGANGLTFDAQGRLIAAEHGNRRISRTEKNGSVVVLADRFEGKRLNSPNDVVMGKNGDAYFTDPPGLARSVTGDVPAAFKPELDFNGVFRVSPSGRVQLVTKDAPFPNGIAFSPDGKKLYVGNSRPEKYWLVYDVHADGSVANGKKLFDATALKGDGGPDGMKVDMQGNLYLTGPGGILIVSPAGKHLGTIAVPETPANLAWGDADGKTLYIAALTSLYRVRLSATGFRP